MLGIVDYRTAGLFHFTIVLRITRRFQLTVIMAINPRLTCGNLRKEMTSVEWQNNDAVGKCNLAALGVSLGFSGLRQERGTRDPVRSIAKTNRG